MWIDYKPTLRITKNTDKNGKVYYTRSHTNAFRTFRMGRENAEFLISQHPEIEIK